MKLVWPYQKMTCPFCNNEFPVGEWPIVSKVTSGKELYIPPRKRQPPETNTFKLFWSSVWMPAPEDFKHEQARYRCPFCDKLRHHQAGETEDITIAIIGDVFSGKSHFIISMIDQLKKLQMNDADGYIRVRAVDKEIEDQYLDLHRSLFVLKRPLLSTQRAFATVDNPLIYRISIYNPDGTYREFNLLIYDASGEDFADPTALIRYKSHILNAKAIIYMADLWAMPAFIDRVTDHLQPLAPNKPQKMAFEILDWAIDTFREERRSLATGRFPLPTAMVLSKADLIEYHPILCQKYELLWRPDYATLYNTDIDEIDSQVRDFLRDIHETGLLGRAQGIERVKFLTMSATGVAANDENKYEPEVRPFRCLDPLLWILRELDKIS